MSKLVAICTILTFFVITGVHNVPRIIGGIEAVDRKYFFYVVSIRHDSKHICGGSIIDEKYILTASHCVFYADGSLMNTNLVTVVSGDLNIQVATNDTIVSEVSKIIPHPDYNPRTTENDVALIQLKEKLPISKYVKPIEYAEVSPTVQSNCMVLGWGFTKEGGTKSDVLHFLDLPIIDQAKCNEAYGGLIKDGMICAGFMEGGRDACQFDSGGPLKCGDTLSGIVSWGKGCAQTGYPGVYTDVAKYAKFIKSTIQPAQKTGDVDVRIIGGTEVKNFKDFAYQVSIRYKSKHICGGAIIDDQHILTASHCVVLGDDRVVDVDHITIAVGTDKIKNDRNAHILQARYIFTHEKFDEDSIVNDIALIRVNGHIKMNDVIQPILLNTDKPIVGKKCVVSGWGVTKYRNSELSDKLQQTEVTILNVDTCNNNYKGGIHRGMICAGEWAGGKDACQGDSGGPLVCNQKLTGVVSWGVECGSKDLPGVYTDVALYRAWIDEQKARSSAPLTLLLNKYLLCVFVTVALIY